MNIKYMRDSKKVMVNAPVPATTNMNIKVPVKLKL